MFLLLNHIIIYLYQIPLFLLQFKPKKLVLKTSIRFFETFYTSLL